MKYLWLNPLISLKFHCFPRLNPSSYFFLFTLIFQHFKVFEDLFRHFICITAFWRCSYWHSNIVQTSTAECKTRDVQKKSNWKVILEILEVCSSKYFLLFCRRGFHMFFCLEDTKLFVLYARIKVNWLSWVCWKLGRRMEYPKCQEVIGKDRGKPETVQCLRLYILLYMLMCPYFYSSHLSVWKANIMFLQSLPAIFFHSLKTIQLQ